MKWLTIMLVSLPCIAGAQATSQGVYTGPISCNTCDQKNAPQDPNYPANGPAVSPGPTMFCTSSLERTYLVEVNDSREQAQADQHRADVRMSVLSTQQYYRLPEYRLPVPAMSFRDLYDLTSASAGYRSSILTSHDWKLIATRDTGMLTIETYSQDRRRKHRAGSNVNTISIVYEKQTAQDGSSSSQVMGITYYGTDYNLFRSANIFALNNDYQSDVDTVTLSHPYLDFSKDNYSLRLRYTKARDTNTDRYTVVFCREY